jgi:hypothetical protein
VSEDFPVKHATVQFREYVSFPLLRSKSPSLLAGPAVSLENAKGALAEDPPVQCLGKTQSMLSPRIMSTVGHRISSLMGEIV